jgi:hypothetical protein
MQFSKTTMPPFTHLELFSHGLKSMEMNFNIFPGQHNHQIWTSLNQAEWYQIPLEIVETCMNHSKKDCGCIEGKRLSDTILSRVGGYAWRKWRVIVRIIGFIGTSVTISLNYNWNSSYLQARQRYRWFTHFPVHRCTCTRILNLHQSLLCSGSQHMNYHFKSLWRLLVIYSSIIFDCRPDSPIIILSLYCTVPTCTQLISLIYCISTSLHYSFPGKGFITLSLWINLPIIH